MAISNGNGQGGGHITDTYYINVKNSYNKIHRTTWAYRSAGMLAGATWGAFCGAVAGLLAAFVPFILGVAVSVPALGAIAASVGTFSVITATIGMAITADVAANASSSAMGLEEKVRRERLAQEMNGQCVGPDCPPDMVAHHEDAKNAPFFNWKIAAVTIPLFAVFGALAGFHPFTASLIFPAGAGVAPFAGLSGAAASAASAGVFGIFGTFMATRNSMVTNKLTNFYYSLLTGEMFEKDRPREMSLQVQPQIETESVVEKTVDAPSRSGKTFSTEELKYALQKLIEKREKPCADQEVALRR